MNDIQNLLAATDAVGLAHLVQRREVQPIELVEAAIGLISHADAGLNFMAETLFNEARQAALRVDPTAPLAGVPTVVKDLFPGVGGACMSNGSRLFSGVRAPGDDEVVTRMRRAGLVILGTSTAPELGLNLSTESALHGATRNPWNPALSAGGSSGGSSVAVAARVVPLAHASDGGGSIRVPASACHLFGLKPTRGRVPMGPQVGEGWGGLACVHAVSRSVRDSAQMLDCLHGPDAGAPYHAPAVAGSFRSALDEPLPRLRIRLLERTGTARSADSAAVVARAARLAQDLGCEVEPLPQLPVAEDQAWHHLFVIMAANVRALLGMVERMSGRPVNPQALEPWTRVLLAAHAKDRVADYVDAVNGCHTLGRTMAGLLQPGDLLLMPTTETPTPPLGYLSTTDESRSYDTYRERFMAYAPTAPLFNMSGQPAMTVPLYRSAQGTPLGAQFVASQGGERALLTLAAHLERAAPWAQDRPEPVAASSFS